MPVIEYLRLGKDLPTEIGAQTGRGIEVHFTLEMRNYTFLWVMSILLFHSLRRKG